MKIILLGIDFGTTNTVITIFKNNKYVILTDNIFKKIPSKICFYNNKIYCGNYIPSQCTNIIQNFKIYNDNITIKNFILGNNKYNYTEILIIFFKHLYDIIINYELLLNNNKYIIKAVITVPSDFNDIQREIIKKCFELVNINIIRIINEPSAGALSYGLNLSINNEEKILVIDTGGGTMDITLLEKNDNFFEVIDSFGYNNLGGNIFTQIILDNMIKNNIESNFNIAQNIKEKLTYLNELSYLDDNNNNYYISRDIFNKLLIDNNIISDISNILINKINNENYKFDNIILIGGTSKIQIFQDTIKNIIKNINIIIHPNLEYVVSEGACIYANIIENNKINQNKNDLILVDVLPLSLGIELADGTFSIIIPKNTPLPIKRGHKYTTDKPTDNNINIKVFQGERNIANKNKLIGNFNFNKFKTGGFPIIEIIFKVDLNSIITINIIDIKTNIEEILIIKNLPDINKNDLESILNDCIKLNENDDDNLKYNQYLYLIKIHIENSLINLNLNSLISTTEKNKIIDYFNTIENNINNSKLCNLQLLEILNNLQNNYTILATSNNIFNSDLNSELDNNNLNLNNLNSDLDYLNSELDNLNLELDNKNLELDNYYKNELNKLCIFLKNEIENENIKLINNDLLIKIINNKCNLLLQDNCNWENELQDLNNFCYKLYHNLT
jgi:molecular chaperone DnaK